MTERQLWRQRATTRPEPAPAMPVAPAAVTGPHHVALTQLAATLDAAPAVARTAAAARTLRRAAPPGPAAPVQRVVIDSKRPGWRLDKFERRDRIYTDLAAKLGGGDDMIERFEHDFPHLYETHVARDDIEVDIRLMVEQAVAGRIASPEEINQLGADRHGMRGVIAAASGALAAAGVGHVVQGSGASMLLGAAAHEAPADVDIIVTDMVAGTRALLAAGFARSVEASGAAGGAMGSARTSSAGLPAMGGRAWPLIAKSFARGASSSSAAPAKAGDAKAAAPQSGAAAGQGMAGSLAVRKFTHIATGTHVDMVMEGEMGGLIKNMGSTVVDGVPTLTPFEAIKSLDYRIAMTGGARPKDIAALHVLVAKYRADLTSEQQVEVDRIVQKNRRGARGPQGTAAAPASAAAAAAAGAGVGAGAGAAAAAAASATPATPAAASTAAAAAPLPSPAEAAAAATAVATTPAANKDGQL